MGIINTWLERFNSSGKSVADEIAEVNATIRNECMWMNGSSSDEECALHCDNITRLTQYRNILTELL